MNYCIIKSSGGTEMEIVNLIISVLSLLVSLASLILATRK